MNRAVVGVGSNTDPQRSIARARKILSAEQRLMAESDFVTTAPIGFSDQPDFVNGAFLVETGLDRDEFRGYLRQVEDRLGRVRTANRFGPRSIDLDIVVWNGTVVDTDYASRDFLQAAVRQVLPDLDKARGHVRRISGKEGP